MKKKKKQVGSLLTASRLRYISAGWTMRREGERIYCYDVIEGKKVYFTIEEWEEKQKVMLSPGEHKLYAKRIAEFWKGEIGC